MTPPSANCAHSSLYLESDDFALRYGYIRPTEQKRLSSEKLQIGRASKSKVSNPVSPSTFTGPLLLPGDDLSTDPKYPAQTLLQWTREKDRNPVTPERNVVYIATHPKLDDSVKFMGAWTSPTAPKKSKDVKKDQLKPPGASDIIEYIKAYYHGMEVKTLSHDLTFTAWDTGAKKKATKVNESPKFVGLKTPTESIRIRTRAPPDGSFPRQINSNDVLDVAIEVLPNDAYALLLLVDHDLYEDDEDEFICGRAYGASRVGVVSSARYHPALDARAGIDPDHAWPASHCKEFVERMREADSEPPKKKPKTQKSRLPPKPAQPISAEEECPLTDALKSHKALSSAQDSTKAYEGLWLGRVCKTAAHELGHCFGMDHCVFYACSMQGSGSIAEDPRQPPYLCPVDLAKMLNASGADAIERYKGIQAFCAKHAGHVQLFAAFHAWIEGRLKELAPGPETTSTT